MCSCGYTPKLIYSIPILPDAHASDSRRSQTSQTEPLFFLYRGTHNFVKHVYTLLIPTAYFTHLLRTFHSTKRTHTGFVVFHTTNFNEYRSIQ